jgi:hypothetical protein
MSHLKVNIPKIRKRTAADVQTPTHWNLVGRSMTTPSPCVIAQEYSSVTLTLRSDPCEKEFGLFKKKISFL